MLSSSKSSKRNQREKNRRNAKKNRTRKTDIFYDQSKVSWFFFYLNFYLIFVIYKIKK